MTKRLHITTSALLAALVACALLRGPSAAAQVPPQDVVTVGSTTGFGGTVVDVPVYIRDTSGTPVGVDQPPGAKLQSWSIKVNYAPASSVQSISFTRAGITTSLTPQFEASPSSAGAISIIDTFHEATNPVPFTSNAALPGNQVAHLLIQLAPSAPAGTLTLTLDPTLTQLNDEGGDAATNETVANGRLLLVSGAVTVFPASAIPSLSTIALFAVALALAGLAFLKLSR
jgi:hypothetical protein